MNSFNAKRRYRALFFSLIKVVIAASLLYWLFKSGRLDLSILGHSFFRYPERWVGSLIILFIMEIFITLRWKMILDLKSSTPLKFLEVFKLTWIGLFFNPILPGAVSGDLVKVYYAKDLDKNMNTNFLLTSVLFDRIIGLCGLVMVMGITIFFNIERILSFGDKMNYLMQFNVLLLLGVIGVLIFLFSPKTLQLFFHRIACKIPYIGRHLALFMENFWVVGNKKITVLKTLIISMICQSLGLSTIWLLSSPYYNVPMGLLDFFTIAPIGMVVISIPIAPLGLGIGNAVFDTLFALYNVEKGASMFNFYIIVMTILYIFGIFPYLMNSKKLKLKELDQLEEMT